MHIVIITVTGFVGRALAREMIAEGRKVMGEVSLIHL